MVRKPLFLSATALGCATAISLVAGPLSSAAAPTSVPAFPGAEGFGTETTGGRGGSVCQVTNLRDSGAGSLRSCVERSGPRHVIFRTGGTIELQERLEIDEPFISIAGQTAPGDGITLRMKPGTGTDDGTLKINTHDVVIRYLRFRPGDGGGADDSHDGISAHREGGGSYNVVLDHNSISWAVDENVNIYYDVENYTLSNNIISEALSESSHPEGEHSKGMLVGGGSKNASIHGNLFTSNVDRNPQISGVSVADVRNNVVYNYGDGSGGGVTLVSSSKGEPKVNWVGNYYKPGPDSPRDRAEFDTYEGSTGRSHQWYGDGNLRWTPNGDQPARIAEDAFGRVSAPLDAAPVTTTSADQAFADVLAGAGASLVRDGVDRRVVGEVRNGGGSFKDEAGPWPTLDRGQAPQDSDGDGMPDTFETAHGTDPSSADAVGDVNRNGYDDIEDWYNGLVAGAGETASGSDGTAGGTQAEPVSRESDQAPAQEQPASEEPLRLVCPVVESPTRGETVTCVYK
jgi:pectate lyase